MTTKYIREPERRLPVRGEYDVVVLGGGPAGIASRDRATGRKTLPGRALWLPWRHGHGGGVTNFCGLHANAWRHPPGRAWRRRRTAGADRPARGLNAPHVVFGKIAAQAYDTAAYKCAADDLLLGAGVEILFHALGAGVVMERDDTVRALIVETKSGRAAVQGRIFIDCSGDGDLAAWAGAPFEHGDGAGSMLYPTMMFRLNGVDPAAAGEAWKTIPALMEEAERRGETFPRKGAIVRPMKHPTEWRINVTQMKRPDGSALDGTDAGELSEGEIEGRRQALKFFDFLKRAAPGFGDAYIVDLPPQIGIRETRRVSGAYQLTGEDVLSCASFPDTIGVNGWPIEKHVAGDVEWLWPAIPQSRGFNHLPYRMLLPQDVRNLLVAGRCAAMTHEGQSAARVSCACFVMGQAAGSAAHLALTGNSPLAEISVEALQRLLEEGGAYLGLDVD
jgi:hypothetical protein